jgi:hypothetical protein
MSRKIANDTFRERKGTVKRLVSSASQIFMIVANLLDIRLYFIH